MQWLFENPIPGLVTGGLLTALALISLARTGRYLYLAVAICLALSTAGVVVLEWLVVTPGERVRDRVHALAADLERNNPERIMAYLSPRSTLRDEAERILREVKIKDAVVKSNLQVETHLSQGLATATFNAVILLDAPRRDLANYRHARQFVLHFRYEDGEWMISDYHENKPW